MASQGTVITNQKLVLSVHIDIRTLNIEKNHEKTVLPAYAYNKLLNHAAHAHTLIVCSVTALVHGVAPDQNLLMQKFIFS